MADRPPTRVEQVTEIITTTPGISPYRIARALGMTTKACSNALHRAVAAGHIVPSGHSHRRRYFPTDQPPTDPGSPVAHAQAARLVTHWRQDLTSAARTALSGHDLDTLISRIAELLDSKNGRS